MHRDETTIVLRDHSVTEVLLIDLIITKSVQIKVENTHKYMYSIGLTYSLSHCAQQNFTLL